MLMNVLDIFGSVISRADEMMSGGYVIETNKQNILNPIELLARAQQNL